MFNVVIEKSLKEVTKKEMLQLKDLTISNKRNN